MHVSGSRVWLACRVALSVWEFGGSSGKADSGTCFHGVLDLLVCICVLGIYNLSTLRYRVCDTVKWTQGPRVAMPSVACASWPWLTRPFVS